MNALSVLDKVNKAYFNRPSVLKRREKRKLANKTMNLLANPKRVHIITSKEMAATIIQRFVRKRKRKKETQNEQEEQEEWFYH